MPPTLGHVQSPDPSWGNGLAQHPDHYPGITSIQRTQYLLRSGELPLRDPAA